MTMPRRKKRLTPGQVVLTRFAAKRISVRRLGKLVDRDHTSLVRMAQRGPVSSALQPELLRVAKEHDVELTADELINGAAA